MTTDRRRPDSTPELQGEFWGEDTQWTPRREPKAANDTVSTKVGRWWDSVLGGGAVTQRSHGRTGAAPAPFEDDEFSYVRPDAGDHALHDAPHDGSRHARDDFEAAWMNGDQRSVDDDEAWTLEPQPQPRRQPGIDPLIARLGALAVIVTLAAPLVVGFTASGADSEEPESRLATISTVAATDPTTTAVTDDGSAAPAATAAPAAAVTPDTAAVTETPSTVLADDGEAESEAAAPETAVAAALEDDSEPEPATTPAVTAPPCGAQYEVGAGDYWIRIADAAGVSLSSLLDVNGASVDTVLVPGRSICLPVGASTPAPPTTVAPAPSSTAPPTTTAPSRPAPTTPPAPTTTVAPRPPAAPESEAVAIIRSVWPDHLEERAIQIAWRESNHQSNVNNYCCYGLFQIYFEVHRSWLGTVGVTSATDLFDPLKNTTAAYTLYQRAGGWGPWGG